MADSGPYSQSSYFRQRRNLIGISLLLFAYVGTGVSFDKLTVLGQSLTLNNPEFIDIALWVTWIYLFWRYYQYWREIGPAELKSAYNSGMHRFVPRLMLKRAKTETLPQLRKDHGNKKFAFRLNSYATSHADPRFWELQIDYGVSWDTGAMPSAKYDGSVSGRPLTQTKWRSRWHVVTSTPYFTEHVLPYLVAALPVLYFLYGRLACTPSAA